MDLAQIIALSMGLAWASGINVYAAIAMLGILGATGHMTLPPGLELLADPLVIMAAAFMYCVESSPTRCPASTRPGIPSTRSCAYRRERCWRPWPLAT